MFNTVHNRKHIIYFIYFFSLRNFNAEHSDWTGSTKLIIKSSHKIKEKNSNKGERVKLYSVTMTRNKLKIKGEKGLII